MEYDGEMHPKGNHPTPGPHASTQDDNSEDTRYQKGDAGQIASSEFSDAQDFGDGLQKDPDALDRHPKTHRGAGMGG